MDNKTIFTKTTKGLGEALGKTKALSRDFRNILKEIDGKASVEQLQSKLDYMAEPKLQDALAMLAGGDYIREFASQEVAVDDELDFTLDASPDDALTALTMGAFLRELSAPGDGEQASNTIQKKARIDEILAKERLEQRVRKDAEELAIKKAIEQVRRDSEEKARRLAEAQARREAEEQARKETAELARREAEQAARREVEVQARKAAEEQARKEAAERARREAEQAARREDEAQARKAAEEQARKEAAELAARREAEAQARKAAEEQARKEAAEQARREAEQAARREAETQARNAAEEQVRKEAAEQARREAEQAARREAEEQQEIEERTRKEEDERIRKETEERARRESEAQAILLAEEEARRQAEIQARNEAETKARLEAEQKARQEIDEKTRRKAVVTQIRRDAIEKYKRDADERARKEAEDKLGAAAENQARLEAEQQARVEAELQALREADERAEQQVRHEEAQRVQRDAEEQAQKEAEENIRLNAEAQARLEADQEVRREAEEAIRIKSERVRRENEERASKQAEQQAKKLAEREAKAQARLAAEAQARNEAEQRVRDKAAEKARREAEKQAERDAKQAKVLLAAEARAQRNAEKRSKTDEPETLGLDTAQASEGGTEELTPEQVDDKAERLAAREAGVQAEREAEREAEQAAILDIERAAAIDKGDGKHYRQPIRWGAYGVLLFFSMIAVGLVLLQIMSFDEKASLFEKMAAAQFRQPVSIGRVSLALLPQPHWRLAGVSVGKDAQIKVSQIDATAEFDTLFSDKIVFKSIALSAPVMNEEGLDWLLFGKSEWHDLTLRELSASNAELDTQKIHLPAFDAKVEIGVDGKWQKATLDAVDRKTHIELQPHGDTLQVEMTADAFPKLFGSSFPLEKVDAKGIASRHEVTLTQFNGILYDGVISGYGKLKWANGWSLSGELTARQINAAQLAPQLIESGTLEATATYALLGQTADRMFAAPRLRGTANIRNGVLLGVDLAGLLRNHNGGGESSFAELGSGFSFEGGVLQLRNTHLGAGLVSASGGADLDAGDKLSGRFTVDLDAPSHQAHANVVLSGTLEKPRFSR